MNAEANSSPLTPQDLDRLMTVLGPYERAPHIAVAVSGGADSMALTLLADKWIRGRGGKLSALTVDHGLRAGSAREARQVGAWLSSRQIDHYVLTWMGDKPTTGIQAAARTARYTLLNAWCKQAGVLHLLLAHHLEDQAETVLMRLGRGSGVDGLAGMSSIVEKGPVRILRPLLSVPKERLRATLQVANQPWVDDPSNDNPVFERVRLRQSFPDLADKGLTPEGLAETGSRMARARMALEDGTSKLLAQCCTLLPAGYARMDGDKLFSAPEELSLRALSRVLLCIGGSDFPPSPGKLERFHEKMKATCFDGLSQGGGASLGKCRTFRTATDKARESFLICREDRYLPQSLDVQPGQEYEWDRRFMVSFNPQKTDKNQDLKLQALGASGLDDVVTEQPEIKTLGMPRAACLTLPVLADEKGILSVPHLNFRRCRGKNTSVGFEKAVFQPRQTLSGAGFIVAE